MNEKSHNGARPDAGGCNGDLPGRDPGSLENIKIDPLMTIRDVQSITRIGHKSTIYRLIQKGDFPAPLKIGSSSRWPTSWIIRFLDGLKLQQNRENQ